LRKALPNATFVGFTGTPLTAGDTTAPIYYKPRIVKLTIEHAGAKKAEAQLAEYASRDEDGRETPENIRVPVEAQAALNQKWR
jgi:type I restriction enzyme R subunit